MAGHVYNFPKRFLCHYITNGPTPLCTGLWPEHAFGGFKNGLRSFLKLWHLPASSQGWKALHHTNELPVPMPRKMSHLLREFLLPRQTALPAFLISAKCLGLFSAGGQGHKSI